MEDEITRLAELPERVTRGSRRDQRLQYARTPGRSARADVPEVVLPVRSAALRRPGGVLNGLWPVGHLAEVIRDLADHGQAVLSAAVAPVAPASTGTSTAAAPGPRSSPLP
ncbi:hypothetical protein [Streptomyces sp. NPDC054834]